MMTKLFGPNWKTTITGSGAAIASFLTVLAMLPQDTGLQVIPQPYRDWIIKVGMASALILRVLMAFSAKDAKSVTPPAANPPADEGK